MNSAGVIKEGVPGASDFAQQAANRTRRSALDGRWTDRFKRITGTCRYPLAIVALAVLLTLLPGLARIAPLVESDYAYQLLAADRMFEGLGPTSLQPVAPNQPWDWSYDWGFLTQWPVGYPALVCGVRWVTGGTSLDAARILSIVSCAAALVGWFLWLLRMVPSGVTRWLVAVVGAATAVSVTFLVNPSTDAIVVATLPWLMLLATSCARSNAGGHGELTSGGLIRGIMLGLSCGTLFWIRYASLFIPAAFGFYFLVQCLKRRVRARELIGFTLASVLPVASLVLLNRALGDAASTSTIFNLGSSVGLSFDPSLVVSAWSHFTALGYFDHRPFVRVLIAVWPPIAILILLVATRMKGNAPGRSSRSADAVSHAGHSVGPDTAQATELHMGHGSAEVNRARILLSACVLASSLTMLVLATALFGEKYNYVGLERYYLPIRPLYFALFVLPLLAVRIRGAHVVIALVTLVGLLWTVQVDGRRVYVRASATQFARSPYGQWVRSFGPDPTPLYAWLTDRCGPDLVVLSNYHEYLSLETGIVTLPIPQNRSTLERWLKRIKSERGIVSPDVLFVLDPHNRWRSHWIPEPPRVIETFQLNEPIKRFTECDAVVYKYNAHDAPE